MLANVHLSDAWCKSSIILLTYYFSTPIKVFDCICQVLPIRLICHTPMLILPCQPTSRHPQHLARQRSSQIAALQWPQHSIIAYHRPMAVFSGFYESPGLPPSGDARGIVPPHHNDRRNGWNGHQSCSSPPPILLVIIIAKDHVMVH